MLFPRSGPPGVSAANVHYQGHPLPEKKKKSLKPGIYCCISLICFQVLSRLGEAFPAELQVGTDHPGDSLPPFQLCPPRETAPEKAHSHTRHATHETVCLPKVLTLKIRSQLLFKLHIQNIFGEQSFLDTQYFFSFLREAVAESLGHSYTKFKVINEVDFQLRNVHC